MQAYRDVLSRAQNVGNLPYVPYRGELVPGLNPQQFMGIGQINQYAQSAQPTMDYAVNAAKMAASPITQNQIQSYINPWTQNVVNTTAAQFANQNIQQAQGLRGSAIAQGALGGDRAGIAQAELANQQNLAQAPVIAGLESQGYLTGLNTALTEQQALANSAYSLGNLGVAQQGAGLSGANAVIGAGTLQQQTQQAQDIAAYQQFLNQQAFPYQQTGWLAGIDTGVGSNMGGTSTSNFSMTGPSPSAKGQIGGGALSGLGMLGKKGMNRGGRVNGMYRGGGVMGSDRQHLQGGGIAGPGAGVGGWPYAMSQGYIPTVPLTHGPGPPQAHAPTPNMPSRPPGGQMPKIGEGAGGGKRRNVAGTSPGSQDPNAPGGGQPLVAPDKPFDPQAGIGVEEGPDQEKIGLGGLGDEPFGQRGNVPPQPPGTSGMPLGQPSTTEPGFIKPGSAERRVDQPGQRDIGVQGSQPPAVLPESIDPLTKLPLQTNLQPGQGPVGQQFAEVTDPNVMSDASGSIPWGRDPNTNVRGQISAEPAAPASPTPSSDALSFQVPGADQVPGMFAGMGDQFPDAGGMGGGDIFGGMGGFAPIDVPMGGGEDIAAMDMPDMSLKGADGGRINGYQAGGSAMSALPGGMGTGDPGGMSPVEPRFSNPLGDYIYGPDFGTAVLPSDRDMSSAVGSRRGGGVLGYQEGGDVGDDGGDLSIDGGGDAGGTFGSGWDDPEMFSPQMAPGQIQPNLPDLAAQQSTPDGSMLPEAGAARSGWYNPDVLGPGPKTSLLDSGLSNDLIPGSANILPMSFPPITPQGQFPDQFQRDFDEANAEQHGQQAENAGQSITQPTTGVAGVPLPRPNPIAGTQIELTIPPRGPWPAPPPRLPVTAGTGFSATAGTGALTRGERNNNPGNIKRGPDAINFGATGFDAQNHAIFPDWQSGADAQAALLQRHYNGMTVPQMSRVYTTSPFSNDWARGVMKFSGYGPTEKPNLNDPTALSSFQRAIWHQEGTRPPWMRGGGLAGGIGGDHLPYAFRGGGGVRGYDDGGAPEDDSDTSSVIDAGGVGDVGGGVSGGDQQLAEVHWSDQIDDPARSSPGLMELNRTAASPMDALITDRQMQQDRADAATAQQAFPNYPTSSAGAQPDTAELPSGDVGPAPAQALGVAPPDESRPADDSGASVIPPSSPFLVNASPVPPVNQALHVGAQPFWAGLGQANVGRDQYQTGPENAPLMRPDQWPAFVNANPELANATRLARPDYYNPRFFTRVKQSEADPLAYVARDVLERHLGNSDTGVAPAGGKSSVTQGLSDFADWLSNRQLAARGRRPEPAPEPTPESASPALPATPATPAAQTEPPAAAPASSATTESPPAKVQADIPINRGQFGPATGTYPGWKERNFPVDEYSRGWIPTSPRRAANVADYVTGNQSSGVPGDILNQARQVAMSGGPAAVRDFMQREGFPQSGPWCGEFAASVVRAAGYSPPSNPETASNWRNFGAPVPWSQVQPGDIAIRKSSYITGGYTPTGATGSHVTFVDGINPNTGQFYGLGGNQGGSREVTRIPFNPADFDFRRFGSTTTANTTTVRPQAGEFAVNRGQYGPATGIYPGSSPWNAGQADQVRQTRGTAPAGGGGTAPAGGGLNQEAYRSVFGRGVLAGHEADIISAARNAGISPSLLAGVIAEETGGGTSHMIRQLNNPGGVFQSGRYTSFPNIQEGIASVARTIAHRLPEGGGTISGLGKIYAPPGAANDPRGTNAEWPAAVTSFERRLRQMGQMAGLQAGGAADAPNAPNADEDASMYQDTDTGDQNVALQPSMRVLDSGGYQHPALRPNPNDPGGNWTPVLDPAHMTANGNPFDPDTGLEWRGGRWRPPNASYPPSGGPRGAIEGLNPSDNWTMDPYPPGGGGVTVPGGNWAMDPPSGGGVAGRGRSGWDFSSGSKIWPAMVTAGAAMMASGSPFFGQALGEGLLAGASAYSNASAAERTYDIDQRKIDLEAQKIWQMQQNESKKQDLDERKFQQTPRLMGHDRWGSPIYGLPDPKTGTLKPIQFDPETGVLAPLGLPGVPGGPGGENPLRLISDWQKLTPEEARQREGALQDAPATDSGSTLSPDFATPISRYMPHDVPTSIDEKGQIHGEGFLDTIQDPTERQLVKEYALGRRPLPNITSRTPPIIRKAALEVGQYDPNYNAQRYKTFSEFAYGKDAANIASFNTAISHAGKMLNTIDDLEKPTGGLLDMFGATNWTDWNAFRNWASRFGNPKLQTELRRFQGDRTALTEELTRAFRMSQGNVHDIENWQKTMDAADSPDGMRAGVQEAMRLLDERISAVADKYNRAMNPAKGLARTKDDLLSPSADAAIKRMLRGESGATQPAAPAGTQPAKSGQPATSGQPQNLPKGVPADSVQSPSSGRWKAPDGTIYNTDGSVYRKAP